MIDDDPRDGMWVALLGVFVAALACIVALVLVSPLGDAEATTAPTVTETVDPRLQTIRVEEDGSYPAGCLPGWPCDDTTEVAP